MEKWIDIVVRWCLGALTMIGSMALGLDANTITWLIVYAGCFFAAWGIGTVLISIGYTIKYAWEKRND